MRSLFCLFLALQVLVISNLPGQSAEGAWIALPYYQNGSWWLPVDPEKPIRIDADYIALRGESCYLVNEKGGSQILLDRNGRELIRGSDIDSIDANRFFFSPSDSDRYGIIRSDGSIENSLKLSQQEAFDLKYRSGIPAAAPDPVSTQMFRQESDWSIVSNSQVNPVPLAMDYSKELGLLAVAQTVGSRTWGAELLVWDISTRSCVWRTRLPGAPATPVSVDIASNGKIAVCGGNGKYNHANYLHVYDLNERKLIFDSLMLSSTIHPGFCQARFVDGGESLLTLSKLAPEGSSESFSEGGELQLVQINPFRQRSIAPGLIVTAVKPIKSASAAIIGTDDGKVMRIDFEGNSGVLLAELGEAMISSIDISEDGLRWAAGTGDGKVAVGSLDASGQAVETQALSNLDGEITGVAVTSENPARVVIRTAGKGSDGFFHGYTPDIDPFGEGAILNPVDGSTTPLPAGSGVALIDTTVAAIGKADHSGVCLMELASAKEIGTLGVNGPPLIERLFFTGIGSEDLERFRTNRDGSQILIDGRLFDFKELDFVPLEKERDLLPSQNEWESYLQSAQANRESPIDIENSQSQEQLYVGEKGEPVSSLLYPNPNTIASFRGLSPSGRHAAIYSQWKGSGHVRLIDLVSKRVMSRPSGGPDSEELLSVSGIGWLKPLDDSGRRLLTVSSDDGTAQIIDYAGGRTLSQIEFGGEAGAVTCSTEGRRLFVATDDANVHCITWDDSGILSPVGQLSLSKDGSFTVSLANGMFMGSGSEQLKSIAIESGAFPIDKAVAMFHQPHLVAKAFGASEEKIRILEKAFVRRCRRDGIALQSLPNEKPLLPDSLPTVSVESNRSAMILKEAVAPITVEAISKTDPLKQVSIQVNGVPLFQWDKRTAAGKSSWKETVPVPLNPGSNMIQVSAMDETGRESLRDTIHLWHDESTDQSAREKNLYLLAFGVSDYARDDLDLAAASKDAKDLAGHFSRLEGSHYRNVFTKLILDREATREALPGAVEFVKQAREIDDVIVFVAGHGFVDDEGLEYWFGTHDIDLEEVNARGISYEELEGLFDGVRSRQRLLLMDTCFAGEIDSGEPLEVNLGNGVKTRAPAVATVIRKPPDGSFDLMQELFSDLRNSSGINVLTASSGMEFVFAEERPEGDNGVFTYCLIDSLKSGESDTDGDGKISISNVNQFLSKRVPEMTNGRQQPTGRQLNLNADFSIGSTAVRPPFDAESFVKGYLKLTSQNEKEDKLSKLFASRVNYFGNSKTPHEIFIEETAYHQKFPYRHFNLDRDKKEPVQSTVESETQRKVVYSISYGMSDDSQNRRNGKQTLEMIVSLEEEKWRISSIRVLSSE